MFFYDRNNQFILIKMFAQKVIYYFISEKNGAGINFIFMIGTRNKKFSGISNIRVYERIPAFFADF